MIQQQIDLLRIYEKKYGSDEAEKIITYTNDFTMITVEQATSSIRNEIVGLKESMDIKLQSLENKFESKVDKSQKETMTFMLAVMAVLIAVIAYFGHS